MQSKRVKIRKAGGIHSCRIEVADVVDASGQVNLVEQNVLSKARDGAPVRGAGYPTT